MILYVKALHIVFVVTWFSGLFYIVRLFIYNTEAGDKPEPAAGILREQFSIMIKRLWLGITWPSAILTLIFGTWMGLLFGYMPGWLWVKLSLVLLLYGYHFSIHKIYKQQMKGIFHFSSQQLRIWNEAATLFLLSIVMVVVVKQALSIVWGILGLLVFAAILMISIKIYKLSRKA
ncbi:MAG: CopD family protein [Chitinophagaceae bacterium]